jgi:hypothetical protein
MPGPHLILAAGTPEELALVRKIKRAENEDQVDELTREFRDSVDDVLPVVAIGAGVALVMVLVAWIQFRSRFAERWPRLRWFLGCPSKLTSRRELAPHPSPLSPRAGEIPLLNRRGAGSFRTAGGEKPA